MDSVANTDNIPYYSIAIYVIAILVSCALGTFFRQHRATSWVVKCFIAGWLLAFLATGVVMWAAAPTLNPKYNPPVPLFSVEAMGPILGALIGTSVPFAAALAAIGFVRLLRLSIASAFLISAAFGLAGVALLPFIVITSALLGCGILGGRCSI